MNFHKASEAFSLGQLNIAIYFLLFMYFFLIENTAVETRDEEVFKEYFFQEFFQFLMQDAILRYY